MCCAPFGLGGARARRCCLSAENWPGERAQDSGAATAAGSGPGCRPWRHHGFLHVLSVKFCCCNRRRGGGVPRRGLDMLPLIYILLEYLPLESLVPSEAL